MSDHLTQSERSANMRKIRSKDTSPELLVRKKLHGLGFRYRLHNANLPGKPDLTLKKYRTAVFVNGCFWHQHSKCRYASIPKSNKEYWVPKLKKNKSRDQRNTALLKKEKWNVEVVWECQTKKSDLFEAAISKIVGRIKQHD